MLKYIMLTAAPLLLIASPADAKPNKDKKNKAENHRADQDRGYDHRENLLGVDVDIVFDDGRNYRARDHRSDYTRHCPPGLAKKGCIPPGQAKKYQIGQRLDDRYGRWDDYRRYDLNAPRDGYYYSRIDNDVVLVDQRTRNINALVRTIDLLID